MIAISRPTAVEALQPFVDAGVLGPTEIEVVTTLARVTGESDVTAVLGAALAVRAPLWGHVCVDLARVAEVVVVDRDAPPEPGPPLPWPDPDAWCAALGASALTRGPDEEPDLLVAPLVLDGTRLYLDRYWRDEQLVAAQLRSRAASPPREVDLARLVAAGPALDRLFGPEGDAVDRQRLAAETALVRRLTVIAGGPGTGKTRTVARLLAVMAELDIGASPALEVALAAPTGKAAARMTEAIAEEVAQADLPEPGAERLRALEATTIHRLLRPDGRGGFRHGREDPLAADVVIVDETSMVSLPLMAALLDAVRPEAQLVLLGDPFQLASVEAGAVLGDLLQVPTASSGVSGPDTTSIPAEPSREPQAGPSPSTPRMGSALDGSVVVLDRVHRFAATSAIGRLADAIRRGDGDAVMAELRAGGAGTPVRWVDPEAGPALIAELEGTIVVHARHVVTAARSGDVEGALGLAGDLAVLSATRRGPTGVARWNALVEDRLAADPDLDLRPTWYLGRPVMVTGNDRLNRVANGDVGITVAPEDRVQVAFRGPDGPRLIEPARLDRIETWWAMTIHKSQGSEFGHTVVVLPPPPSPILTRELLYTAVTRARRDVTILASEAALRAAVARPVGRMSGLADRLRSPSTPTAPSADGERVASEPAAAPVGPDVPEPVDGGPLTLF